MRQELHVIHIVLLETYGNISCRGMVVQVWWMFVKMIEFNIECQREKRNLLHRMWNINS